MTIYKYVIIIYIITLESVYHFSPYGIFVMELLWKIIVKSSNILIIITPKLLFKSVNYSNVRCINLHHTHNISAANRIHGIVDRMTAIPERYYKLQ